MAIFFGFIIFTGGMTALREENERFVLVFHENIYGLNEGGKVTMNGVRIGRVERFFLGDASQDAPIPVLIEVNRKLVRRHMADENSAFALERPLHLSEVRQLLVADARHAPGRPERDHVAVVSLDVVREAPLFGFGARVRQITSLPEG